LGLLPALLMTEVGCDDGAATCGLFGGLAAVQSLLLSSQGWHQKGLQEQEPNDAGPATTAAVCAYVDQLLLVLGLEQVSSSQSGPLLHRLVGKGLVGRCKDG
jgi:hypothetical protein